MIGDIIDSVANAAKVLTRQRKTKFSLQDDNDIVEVPAHVVNDAKVTKGVTLEELVDICNKPAAQQMANVLGQVVVNVAKDQICVQNMNSLGDIAINGLAKVCGWNDKHWEDIIFNDGNEETIHLPQVSSRSSEYVPVAKKGAMEISIINKANFSPSVSEYRVIQRLEEQFNCEDWTAILYDCIAAVINKNDQKPYPFALATLDENDIFRQVPAKDVFLACVEKGLIKVRLTK